MINRLLSISFAFLFLKPRIKLDHCLADAIDFELMERQLEELRAGRSVEVCAYDKRRNERGRDPTSGLRVPFRFCICFNITLLKLICPTHKSHKAFKFCGRHPCCRSGIRRHRSRQSHLLRAAHPRSLRHEALR